MPAETRRFFEHVLANDLPASSFFQSDWSVLNERLARHYGLPKLEGMELRRVSLPAGSPRGGIVTHASIMKLTTNATYTSPVKRGKWILEQILGTPPPPAPPSVPTLEGQQLKGSLRERMEQHRRDPACASCHTRMDAIGFAFEKFDGVGLLRTMDEGTRIDPAGKLSDGRTFSGAGELKQILRKDREKFVRNLSTKLLTYGLGRGLDYYDGPAVDKITDSTIQSGNRFSSVILGVVMSDPFRLRRGTSQGEAGSQPSKK